MAMYVTLVPAYGRDYKSKKAALKDWEEGKDFRIQCIAHRHDGSYTSVRDQAALEAEGCKLSIRYNGLAQSTPIPAIKK